MSGVRLCAAAGLAGVAGLPAMARGSVIEGGLEPVADFNPITDLPTGVQFSFYGSVFVLGTDSFPLADIPLQQMIAKAEAGPYKAEPARVFGFDEIVEAHRAMEEGLAVGKMVVAVS